MAFRWHDLLFFALVTSHCPLYRRGGEQNFANYVWTNFGAIYDPLAECVDAHESVTGWSTIGYASSVVLTNGTLMLANRCTTQQALLMHPLHVDFPARGYENDEEGWNLLPGGKVLTVDAYVKSGRSQPN